MKRTLLLTAAWLAAASASANAGNLSYGVPDASSPFYAPTSMHAADIELGFGAATNGDNTITQLDGTGRLAGPLADWIKGEVEVRGAAYFSDGDTLTSIGAVGHLYKDGPTHAIGAFAGISRFDEVDVYTLGGEVKGYFGQTALTGQAAYLGSSGSDTDVYALTAQVDHYFAPDHKGSAALAYYTGDGGSVWIGSLGVEKRITGTMWSVSASGAYVAASDSSGIWSGRIGARLHFDPPGTTLQQHDRMVPFSATTLLTLAR